jgi:hypothetical protein
MQTRRFWQRGCKGLMHNLLRLVFFRLNVPCVFVITIELTMLVLGSGKSDSKKQFRDPTSEASLSVPSDFQHCLLDHHQIIIKQRVPY